MYTDEVWGKSGPQAAIDITEPVKARRIAMVDEIKRALEIAETVPFRYLIQHIGAGGAEYDERRVDAAFTLSKSSRCSRDSAASRSCWRTFPTNFSTASRTELVPRADSSRSELLLRYRTRQHRAGCRK